MIELLACEIEAREIEWLSYTGSESIPILTGQSLFLLAKDGYSQRIFVYRRPSLDLMIALARLIFLKEGTAVDVGANIGVVSTQLSRRSDITRVLSIEPNLTVFEVLEKNCTAKMVAQPILISSIEQPQIFNQDVSDSGRSGPTSFQSVEKIMTGRTLDSLYIEHFGTEKLNILKIDVQGSEESVLDSSMKLITTSKPVIIIEVESGDSQLDLKLRNRCSQFVKDSPSDYQAFGVGSGGSLKLLALPEIPSGICDVFLVPKSVHIRL